MGYLPLVIMQEGTVRRPKPHYNNKKKFVEATLAANRYDDNNDDDDNDDDDDDNDDDHDNDHHDNDDK